MHRRVVFRRGVGSGIALAAAILLTLAATGTALATVVHLIDSGPFQLTVPAGSEIDVTLLGNHTTPDGFVFGVGPFSSTDPAVVVLVSEHHGADSNTAVFTALRPGTARIQAIYGASGVVCATPSPVPVISPSGAPTPSPVPSPTATCSVADPGFYNVAVTVTPILPSSGRPPLWMHDVVRVLVASAAGGLVMIAIVVGMRRRRHLG
jgi:hypothetical protein